MANSGITECARCRKNLIDEEYTSHICSPIMTEIKEIVVDYSYSIINQNGDRVTIAKGLDNGVLYRLIECKHYPSHRNNPRLKPIDQTALNRKKSNDNLPEPRDLPNKSMKLVLAHDTMTASNIQKIGLARTHVGCDSFDGPFKYHQISFVATTAITP